nr:hypothetical protein CFP56_36194 [Quercus suber]
MRKGISSAWFASNHIPTASLHTSQDPKTPIDILTCQEKTIMALYLNSQPSGFNNHVKNVAIVGASGTIGKHIVKALLEQGKHTVTAISRANSTTDLPNGVRLAPVDYDDENSLVEALQGQDALIISMSTTAPRDTQNKLIIAAAKAGVAWVMPNDWCGDITAHPDMAADIIIGPAVLAARTRVEEQGVSAWVALHCGFWYEYSLAGQADRYGFDITNKKATFFDDGETKISTSTWAQVGRAAAAFFALPILPRDAEDMSPTMSQWKNKPLYISSFLVSQKDMFKALLRATGAKASDWTLEYEDSVERYAKSRALLNKGDFSAFSTVLYTRVFYKDRSGEYESKAAVSKKALGLPTEDLEECTRQAVEMAKTGVFAYHQAKVRG